MANQDEFKKLSAEEQEVIKSFRKKKAESSASKSQSISKELAIVEPREEVEGSSSEKAPVETIDVDSLPTPTSSHQIGDEQPQSVAARIKKRSAKALPIKMRTLEEEEEPRPKKAKSEKPRKPSTRTAPSESSQGPRSFDERPIMSPLIINDDFWSMVLDPEEEELLGSHIFSFHQMLEQQGWDKMLMEEFKASDEVVRDFYGSMTFVEAEEDSPANASIITWKGHMLMLAPQIIGTTLSVQASEGMDVLVRRKTWPKGKGFKSRAEVMQKLYDGKNPKNPQVKTLSLDKKLLHLFLVRNVVPRQEQLEQVTVGDAILMEQIITGSKVNLPAIMLAICSIVILKILAAFLILTWSSSSYLS